MIRAAATKPFGFVAHTPGPGLGGHCILIDKIAQALNERDRAIKGSKILVLGLAYKKNVDDVRESPAAEIMELLREHQFELESVALDAKSLAAHDCVVLVTDHDAFDYELIARHAKLVADTRGRYPNPRSNVVKA